MEKAIILPKTHSSDVDAFTNRSNRSGACFQKVCQQVLFCSVSNITNTLQSRQLKDGTILTSDTSRVLSRDPRIHQGLNETRGHPHMNGCSEMIN